MMEGNLLSGVQHVNMHLTEGMARGCVHETDHLQVMRIRLAPGEALPHHRSNAQVLLVPLGGTISLETPVGGGTIGVGEALSLPYDTPMDVSNAGEDTAVFLVIKTPHPKTFK